MASTSKTDPQPHLTVSFSDSTRLGQHDVHLCSKGFRLTTKWPFQVGAELEFSFEHEGNRHCANGVVVGCDPLPKPAGHFATVLYFTEPLCPKLHLAAQACQLT